MTAGSLGAYRLVLDTNAVVRGLINIKSASGRIFVRCQTRVLIPLLSAPVIDEYRAVLERPELTGRYPELKRPEIAIALERLRYVGDFYRRVKPDSACRATRAMSPLLNWLLQVVRHT